MSRPDPAAALNGVGTGHICDQCNKRIQHGDKAGMYVTWMETPMIGCPAERGASTVVPKRLTPVLTGPTKQFCSTCSSPTSSWEWPSETEAIRSGRRGKNDLHENWTELVLLQYSQFSHDKSKCILD